MSEEEKSKINLACVLFRFFDVGSSNHCVAEVTKWKKELNYRTVFSHRISVLVCVGFATPPDMVCVGFATPPDICSGVCRALSRSFSLVDCQ